MYPRRFWIITGFSLLVASGVMFIPFDVIQELTGVSFLVFLLSVLLVEFASVLVIVWQLLKHRPDEEERESRWLYHP